MLSTIDLRSGRSRRCTPSLFAEQLEARITPKAPGLSYAILSMQDPTVTVSGRVTGTYCAGASVTFTGAISTTVTANLGGFFSFTTTANSLGDVTAIATATNNERSNAVVRTISSDAPAFAQLSLTVDINGLCIVTGFIVNENLFGQTISFAGSESFQGQSTTTGLLGDFSFAVQLGEGETGTIEAVVADCWGLTGSTTFTI